MKNNGNMLSPVLEENPEYAEEPQLLVVGLLFTVDVGLNASLLFIFLFSDSIGGPGSRGGRHCLPISDCESRNPRASACSRFPCCLFHVRWREHSCLSQSCALPGAELESLCLEAWSVSSATGPGHPHP